MILRSSTILNVFFHHSLSALCFASFLLSLPDGVLPSVVLMACVPLIALTSCRCYKLIGLDSDVVYFNVYCEDDGA